MREKKMEKLDHNVSLHRVYLEAQDKMNADILLYKKQVPSSKITSIKFYLFSKVVVLYFKYLFTDIIVKGTMIKLYQRLGYLFVVKSKCNRYSPKKKVFKTVDGKKTVEYKRCEINKTNGYWYFLFWNSPGKWRHYRMKLKIKWKRMIYNEVIKNKKDYLDYSFVQHGRNASTNYIRN